MKWKATVAALSIAALGAALALTVPKSGTQVRTTLSGDLGVPDQLLPIISRACRDCHTYQTRWPWYSRVPIVSSLIEHDVQKGREHVNFSTWGVSQRHQPTPNQIQEVCDAVSDRAMPPRSYRLLHPEARLSQKDIDAFCAWADMAVNLSPSGPSGR